MEYLQEVWNHLQQVDLGWSQNPQPWGVTGAIIQVLCYALFFFYCVRNKHESHPFSWVMFTVDTGLYTYMEWDVGAEWYLLALPAVCSLSSATIAFTLWKRGKFAEYGDVWDWFAVVAFTNLLTAYLMLKYVGRTEFNEGEFGVKVLIVVANTATCAAFWPILRNAYYEPNTEHPLPWTGWTIAYLFLGISTYLDEGAWNILLYGYPVLMIYPLACFVLHGAVAFLAASPFVNGRDRSAVHV